MCSKLLNPYSSTWYLPNIPDGKDLCTMSSSFPRPAWISENQVADGIDSIAETGVDDPVFSPFQAGYPHEIPMISLLGESLFIHNPQLGKTLQIPAAMGLSAGRSWGKPWKSHNSVQKFSPFIHIVERSLSLYFPIRFSPSFPMQGFYPSCCGFQPVFHAQNLVSFESKRKDLQSWTHH